MKCTLLRTADGHALRNDADGSIVFGPTFSLASLSRYTKDHHIVIVSRDDESAPAGEGEGAK